MCKLLEDKATYARTAEASRDFTRTFLKVDQAKIWAGIIAEMEAGDACSPSRDDKVDLDEVRILLEELQYCHFNGFKTRMGQLSRLQRDLAAERERTAVAARDRKRAASAKREVKRLKSSEAYRVGMFVTWPARRVYRLFKRYRKKGFKRMFRRLVLGKSSGSIK